MKSALTILMSLAVLSTTAAFAADYGAGQSSNSQSGMTNSTTPGSTASQKQSTNKTGKGLFHKSWHHKVKSQKRILKRQTRRHSQRRILKNSQKSKVSTNKKMSK